MSNYYTKLELICLAVLLFLVTSCMTVGRIERNCDKFEKVCATEFTVYFTDTVKMTLRDTIVSYIIQREVVHDSVPVYVHGDGITDTRLSRLDTELAYSEAKVTNSLLTHMLVQKDTTITRRLRNALREVEVLRSQSTTKVITVKENTKFAGFCVRWFWGSVALIVAALLFYFGPRIRRMIPV